MPDTTSNLPASVNPAQPIRCRHIKVDGTQCACPALRGALLCYFHQSWHISSTATIDDLGSYLEDYRAKHGEELVQERACPPLTSEKLEHDKFRKKSFLREQCLHASLLLPVLEDANSIQIALMKVMRLLLANAIPHKTAALVLYALQTASANLARINFQPPPDQVVTAPFPSPAPESIRKEDQLEEAQNRTPDLGPGDQ